MSGRKTPANRRTEPSLEALEGRQLLNARVIAPNGKPINDKDLAHAVFQKANNVPLSDRRISYTTPGGSKVQITLFGSGTLAGTSVEPDGSLDLVYNHTTIASKIVGHVIGPDVSLASIRDADVVARSPSSVGSDPLNVVNLKAFNLIADGYINLEGGVGTLALASAGPNSQIHMTGLTTSSSSSSTSILDNSANNGTATGVTGNNVPRVNTVTPTRGGVTTVVSRAGHDHHGRDHHDHPDEFNHPDRPE